MPGQTAAQRVLDLPEIVQRIQYLAIEPSSALQKLTSSGRFSWFIRDENDTARARTLCNFSLVCTSWHDAARKMLFRTVFIDDRTFWRKQSQDRDSDGLDFCYFALRPERYRDIRHVSNYQPLAPFYLSDSTAGRLIEFLNNCRRLESLMLAGEGFINDSIPPPIFFGCARSLRLLVLSEMRISKVSKTIACFPRLEELWLLDIEAGDVELSHVVLPSLDILVVKVKLLNAEAATAQLAWSILKTAGPRSLGELVLLGLSTGNVNALLTSCPLPRLWRLTIGRHYRTEPADFESWQCEPDLLSYQYVPGDRWNGNSVASLLQYVQRTRLKSLSLRFPDGEMIAAGFVAKQLLHMGPEINLAIKVGCRERDIQDLLHSYDNL